MAEQNKDRPDGFLGRWARRKNDALQGKPLDEPAPAKIYIDDYSIPDPLPLSMLRQMASAKFLNLFEEEEDKDKTPALAADQARESDNGPAADSVAHSAQKTQAALPDIDPPDSPLPGFVPEGTRQENHAHTDLRLQPNHPAQEPGAGRSPE